MREEILELLADWSDARREGRAISPESLVARRGVPVEAGQALLAEFRCALGKLAALDELLDTGPVRPCLPGYEVLEELGRGGMGVVYRARQLSLNRVVALKMIRSGPFAGAEARARFRREAEALARLRHPNVVAIYEVGEHDGLPFLCLEFVAGGSLDRRLSAVPQPALQAAQCVQALAQAVHRLHEAGIVHRDLKPANILLDADGSPKVSDFGLAKLLEGAPGQTVSGAVLGTPSYMAPEQAEGRVAAVGARTDVYGLGAILYECLTGKPPFKADTADATRELVRRGELVLPGCLVSGLHRDLEAICLKCLEKEPARRYHSAEALAADLGRWLRGDPTVARPRGAVGRALRWARRHTGGAGLLAAGVLLALVALVAFGGGQKPPPSEAPAPLEQVRALIPGASRPFEDPFGLDGGIFRVRAAPRTSPAYRHLEQARGLLARQFGADPRQRAAVCNDLGNAYREGGWLEEAERYLTEALAVRRRLARQEPADRAAQRDVAVSLVSLGTFFHVRGWLSRDDYLRARRCYREAERLWEGLGEGGSDAAWEARLLDAWLSVELEQYEEACGLFDELIRRRPDAPGRWLVRARMGRASARIERGSAGKGYSLAVVLPLLDLSAQMQKAAPDPDWEQALTLFRAAWLVRLTGAAVDEVWPGRGQLVHVGAEGLFRTCGQHIREKRGEGHYYVAFPLFFLGESLAGRGECEEAATAYRECLQQLKRTVGLEHPKAAYVVGRYARVLVRLGRAGDAHRAFDEVLRSVRDRYQGDHWHHANALMEYAEFLRGIEDWPRLEQVSREALGVYERTGGPRRKLFAPCRQYLALARSRQGK